MHFDLKPAPPGRFRRFFCNHLPSPVVISLPERHEEDGLPATATERVTDAPDGLESVFVAHQARVFRAAYRITGNAQDAEDVLQNVFLRLARRQDPRPPEEKLGSYLHRTAINAALDLVRARKRTATVGLEAVEALSAQDGVDGPERAHRSTEIRERLRQALGRVNPRHAEVFVLRYLEGYGNLEIARLLGVSRIAVAVALHRVRGRLEKELRQMRGSSR